MAIDTKTDLIKEIEAFSKALYDYSEIGSDMIPYSKFKPYFSELGILKREDYSEDILDEEAFLVFYGLFFDKISLNPNAEQVSDSKYFNTLYQTYRDKQESVIADLDLFMQTIEAAKIKEATAQNKDGNIEFDAVELFLHHMLIDKICKKIKSKANSNVYLFDLIEKKQDNLIIKFRIVVFGIIFSVPLSAIALVLQFNYARFIFGYISLLLIGFLLVHFFAYRITKQEKEEVKQLPKSFKNYMLGEQQDFNKDFFNDKTTSYLDPLLKDSEIYKYVKAKYIKTESGNGIVYE